MGYQEMKLKELTQAFFELEYKILPLKSCQIKNYYPKPDIRTMGNLTCFYKTMALSRLVIRLRKLCFLLDILEVLNDGLPDSNIKPNNAVYVYEKNREVLNVLRENTSNVKVGLIKNI